MKGLTRLTPQEYSPYNDETVFTVRPLSAFEYSAVLAIQSIVPASVEACRYGIENVRGYLDEDDHPIQCTHETAEVWGRVMRVCSDEFLNTLPIEAIMRIANRIIEISRLSGTERKNSLSLASPVEFPAPEASETSGTMPTPTGTNADAPIATEAPPNGA